MHTFPSWLPRPITAWLDTRAAFWHSVNRADTDFWEKLHDPLEALITYDKDDPDGQQAMREYLRGVQRAVEGRLGHPVIPWWKHGAIWFHHIGPKRSTLHIEWQVPSRHQGIGLSMDGVWEGEIRFHLGIGIVGVWIALEDVKGLPRKERDLSLRWHHQSLWWALWVDDSVAPSAAKRWRNSRWHPLDTLFGKQKHRSVKLGTVRSEVDLPEGRMPVTITFERSTWTRPRWPAIRSSVRAEIAPDVPTPTPGKGENDYDLDDDATYCMKTPADTLAHAVEHYRASILRDRKQYGGSEYWQPTRGGL